jgi:ABC-type phosphate transport system substrate-binding protein
VAAEGVSAVVSQGTTSENGFFDESVAQECVGRLGGLSKDQLRWIFSSLTDVELVEDGWDKLSVPYLDSDPTTHKWSELDEDCADEEIIVAGPSTNSTAAELFSELIFGKTSVETFDVSRPGSNFNSTNSSALSDFLESNGTAIGYFDIGYILTGLNLETLKLVDFVSEESGESIHASAAALEEGSYPLSRLLHFQLLDDEESLAKTRSFVEFIYSKAGDEIVKKQGNWPVAASQKMIMATRIQSKSGIPREVIEAACGPAGGEISIAGSSTVQPVAELWSSIYSSFCDVGITVEGGGSSNGAGRVCADESRGTPVMIGDMSREWKSDEANEVNGFVYECLKGDTTRAAIQVDVAIDGLTVATSNSGDAYECIQILGGLTTDQLRWIYSNYNDQQLEETGWDPSSVPNSDRNSQTHKWNELNSDCKNIEIRIAGADDQSGTYEYFLETILVDYDNGETFDVFRPGFAYFNSEDDDLLVDYIFTYPEGTNDLRQKYGLRNALVFSHI